MSGVIYELAGLQMLPMICVEARLIGKYEVDFTSQEQQEFFLLVSVWGMRAVALR